MSQSAPPTLQQEDGPNPLEIFFEKNKKWIIAFAVLLVVATGTHYGLDAANTAKRNAQWSSFGAETGLNEKLAKIDLSAYPAQYQQFGISQHWNTLVTKLHDDLESADQAAIDKQIAESKGQEKEPWLIWVAANKAYSERRWADVQKHCEDLTSRFSDHLLCAKSEFPPQVLEEKEKDKEKKKKDDEPQAAVEPEYKPAKAGSMVGMLLARVKGEETFESDHPGFFKAPDPDSSETVVVKFASDVGEIEIAFYPDAAKKHVEEFKKNFSSGFYKGFRVHKIKRHRKGGDEETSPRTIHLGNPNSKDEDRSKWSEVPEAKDEDILDFETSDLSFFPGMVAAEQEKDGKSSARRFFIAVNDCASGYDGDYVVFGRVIRGMDVLEDIASGDFLDQSEQDSGEGRPSREVLVETTEVKKK